MNNQSLILMIGWQTRNWRHHEKAVKWCKDYGFEPVFKTVFIGELYAVEKKELYVKFMRLFTKKTEKFFFSVMCRTCFNASNIDLRLKQKAIKSDEPFELVQIPQKPS